MIRDTFESLTRAGAAEPTTPARPLEPVQPIQPAAPAPAKTGIFAPEPIEEEEELGEECDDPANYPRWQLRWRIGFVTEREAFKYAEPIGASWKVFKRCNDGLYQVVVFVTKDNDTI